MADYVLWVCECPSSKFIAEIRDTPLSWSDTLNDAQQATFTLNRRDPRISADLLAVDGTREIHVLRDGIIVASGILWSARPSSHEVAFEAAGFADYYSRRTIRDTITAVDVEQFDLVRQIVQQTDTQTFGTLATSLNLLVEPESTAIKRTITFDGKDHTKILEAIKTLSVMVDGFDFAFDANLRDHNTIVKRLRLWHPARTRSNPVILEHNLNCVAESTAMIGGEPNIITVYGKDTEGTAPRSVAWRQASTNLAVEETVTDTDLVDQAGVDAESAGKLAAATTNEISPKLRLIPQTEIAVADIELGDLIRVVVDDFYRSDFYARVTQMSVTVGNSEQIDLTLSTANQASSPTTLATLIGGLRDRIDRLERRGN